MGWFSSKPVLVALLLGFLHLNADAATQVATVSGIVTDEKGGPLEDVTVQVSGIEKLRGGAWRREMRSGMMPSFVTDREGRFVLPFHEADIRYDLWFDKPGFAPTFRHGVSAESQDLRIVMNRGTPVTGVVTRLVGEEPTPVCGVMVELQLPAEDLWYRQRAFTDHEGKYTFCVSPPPGERKWQVAFVGTVVALEFKEDEPMRGPDFLATVEVRNRVPGDATRGQATRMRHRYGAYVRYVPRATPRGLLVLAHGTVGRGESAIDCAERFTARWTALAERQRLVVLAPAFDQENYGGRSGPGGGYRGLFGRHVGADVFVNALVDATKAVFPMLPEKFHLYGHSAGGQYVSRYVVMHPDRVEAAVISAAGTYAFPDPDVQWTNGMKPLKRRMRWGDGQPWQQVDIVPDPKGWVKAAQIPIAVVVGGKDTGETKAIPGNPGRNHVERARHWVKAMKTLAKEHGKSPRVRLIEVQDVGHNSELLTPACQRALF